MVELEETPRGEKEDNYHFITYMPIDGRLYELDGLLDAPVDHGPIAEGQEWLDECAARMRVVFHRSNFYNVMHTLYAELGTFGTAFAFELADPRRGFGFVPLCAGEYALDCNERRRVDTVFRRVSMSLRQMAASFGPKDLGLID